MRLYAPVAPSQVRELKLLYRVFKQVGIRRTFTGA